MNWKLLWLFVCCVLVLPQSGAAQLQTIRKEVRQIFGGSQSPDNARIAAITRAKREALEEAGTYLESLTIVREHQVAKDEILALSSGVLRATVIKEENFIEGSAFGIRVVAEVQVDLSILEERVRKLLADREHLERLRAAEGRERELLKKLEELEAENTRLAARGTARQRETLKEGFRESTAKLTAQEWFMKGVALWNGSAFDPAKEAAEYFSEALRLDPDHAFTYYNRGIAYNNLGQYQRAIEDYDQTIRLDPGDAFAYNNRGVTYCMQGQYRRAIKDCDQAIRLDPDYAETYNVRGIAYYNLGQYRRAIEDYDQAIRLDPDYANAYHVRGIAYFDQRQYWRAIADCDQAISLDPDDAGTYVLRGIAYHNLGQYRRAIADCDQAISLDPDDAGTYYNRGAAYHKLGQRAKALQDWRRACEMGHQPACERVK